jgi:excisionase family DNA binding protein
MITTFNKIDYRSAAEALGLSEATLRRMVSRRQIPHYKILKRVYFDLDELRAWVDQRKVLAATTGR